MFRFVLLFSLLPVLAPLPLAHGQSAIPAEPVEIGTRPQLFLDNYIVDNTWTMRYKAEHVNRVFHTAVKHPDNPLLSGAMGYCSVAHDAEAGIYHLWYQSNTWTTDEATVDYAIAYARSNDGIHWERPNLGLHERRGNRDNNIVIRGPRGRASGGWLLNVPEDQKRGYRYLYMYRDRDGFHLIGSHDGVHFDPQSDQRILHLHSDTQNTLVYDPHRQQYVIYCRAKAIYRAGGTEMIDTGESRRVGRIASSELWTDWSHQASNILLVDEQDTLHRYHALYGMPVTEYAGVFFGFAWLFRWNDRIHPELAWSRDSLLFQRPAVRNRLIDYGPEGSWDDEMVFASSWIEVGDEWRIYYAGWDGPHDSRERNGGLGLATLRKEGFCSLAGPRGGGVVCTRVMRWPGGHLLVNCDAPEGKLTVRVSGPDRKVIPGFDHKDCRPFTGDATAAEITWREASIDQLQGEDIRLEIYIENCHLYSFRASP